MIRIFSGLLFASSNRQTAIKEPINPASEDVFYNGTRAEKESFVPNIEYQLQEIKLNESGEKQNSSILCTDKQVTGKPILDIARLDSKDKITDPIIIDNDASGLKKIEEILAEVSNSWTSRDSASNNALDDLKPSYGLGFVDMHDPECYSKSSGNRYIFLKLPLKNSSGSLIPIARTRNWRGEPVYLNPTLTLGKFNGREFVLFKYRGTYLAIDHRGGLRIATNVQEPVASVKHRKGWFGGLED